MDKFSWKDHESILCKTARLEQTPNFDCFFIWSIEYVEKTDFLQLITRLLNETGNLL